MSKPDTGSLGRLLLSAMLVATIAAEVAFSWLGWTGQHVFNPEWHPHARYHAAWTVAFVIIMALVGLWLLWRPASDPRQAAGIVAVPAGVYWGTEFFAAFAVPGTSPNPDLEAPNTVGLLGLDVHGNLLFAGMMIVLSVSGGLLARSSTTTSAEPTLASR